jgi:Protein of unknown function (DUF2716)
VTELIAGWRPMNFGPEYERYWAAFDERFDFRPNYAPEVRPGIKEPVGSVTLSLAPIFDAGRAGFAAGEAAINAEVLRAFVAVLEEHVVLLALDWQHEGFWFRPHEHALRGDPWPIPPFPNGDYYIFLTDDMSMGTFGHPWEQTLCVFGEQLVDQLVPVLASWLPTVRRDGAATR